MCVYVVKRLPEEQNLDQIVTGCVCPSISGWVLVATIVSPEAAASSQPVPSEVSAVLEL